MRSSSPTTMPSTSASWTACSSVSISAGIAPSVPVGEPPAYVTAVSFSSSMTPRSVGFLADRELQRRDARAEPLLELVERALRTTRARGRAC